MLIRPTIAILLALSLTGCSTTGGKILSFFGVGNRAAARAEKAEAVVAKEEAKVETAAVVVDTKRDDLLKKAQEEAHRTDMALPFVPESRAKEIATASSANATGALDEALGAVPVSVLNDLRDLNTRLLSDNAEVRAKAELDATKARESLEATAAALVASKAALDRQNAALDAAQEKLNEANQRAQKEAADNVVLANERRAAVFQMWLFRWLLVGVLVLGGLFVLYLKLQLGGVGKGLAAAKRAGLDLSKVTPHLDAVTSWLGQRLIGLARAKAEREAGP